jgi:hypothetical protein
MICAEDLKNIEIIDSLVISSFQTNFELLDYNSGDSLAIDLFELDWEQRNYLNVLIGNLAVEKTFKVFRNYNPTSSFQGLVLSINQFEIEIEYSKPYEKAFLGKNYITRTINIGLRGQFYSARTDEVKQAVDSDQSYKDEILYGLVTDIENPNYQFSKGKREDYTFWEKIYEPVLVIASVGVVVYLFFTQRT